MKSKHKVPRFLKTVSSFAAVFLLVSFITTCSMVLFLDRMGCIAGITYSENIVSEAAQITFLNVILLSLIFTVIYRIHQKISVDLPVKKITSAAKKITRGDYSVRIPYVRITDGKSGFDEIIDCFNTMAQELEGTKVLHTDFIANVSHEMKTPLTAIQNYATLLREPDLSEEKRKEYSAAATDSCRKLSLLISNILKLNKLENQSIVPNRTEYDLSEQLCECLLQFEEQWEQKRLIIETDIQSDIKIKADAELWQIVWSNLFSNAIKFTEHGGTVKVSLTEENGFITVRVSDTGCGISKESGTKIFDKFYQGDTSHSAQGNGLGLALVKRIIDITGGDITVESELNKGSTFTVKLRR